MAEPPVFFVHLRRPRRSDPRTDPVYEYGSFGCTKCHSKNLLRPRHAEDLEGARLAFVQGGDLGSRLVFLTPPIKVKVWKNNCEAKWTPRAMPFKYADAPVLVCNDGRSDFSLVKQFALESRDSTVVGKPRSLEQRFASKLRSRARQLPLKVARQVVSVYEGARRRAEKRGSGIASAYYEALPNVTCIDRNRKNTYRQRVRELHAETYDAIVVPQVRIPRRRLRPASPCDGQSCS